MHFGEDASVQHRSSVSLGLSTERFIGQEAFSLDVNQMSERREYRLPAFPKRTIREKQGSHRSLSNCRLDYSLGERQAYAIQQTMKNKRIKEKTEAWDNRSCQLERCLNRPIYGHLVITCHKNCSWMKWHGF